MVILACVTLMGHGKILVVVSVNNITIRNATGSVPTHFLLHINVTKLETFVSYILFLSQVVVASNPQ